MMDISTQQQRANLRKIMRNKRNTLTQIEQAHAADALKLNITQLINLHCAAPLQVGAYLANDGEPSLTPTIEMLWYNNHRVNLPVIHPFSGRHLLFQHYEKNSPMSNNRYGILEPKLNCSQLCIVQNLDFLLMPLVAFDQQGNRLGMGGGYYDRTLAQAQQQQWEKPCLIGIAHQCQEVAALPVASWDIPLDYIVTPTRIYQV